MLTSKGTREVLEPVCFRLALSTSRRSPYMQVNARAVLTMGLLCKAACASRERRAAFLGSQFPGDKETSFQVSRLGRVRRSAREEGRKIPAAASAPPRRRWPRLPRPSCTRFHCQGAVIVPTGLLRLRGAISRSLLEQFVAQTQQPTSASCQDHDKKERKLNLLWDSSRAEKCGGGGERAKASCV